MLPGGLLLLLLSAAAGALARAAVHRRRRPFRNAFQQATAEHTAALADLAAANSFPAWVGVPSHAVAQDESRSRLVATSYPRECGLVLHASAPTSTGTRWVTPSPQVPGTIAALIEATPAIRP